MPIDQIYECQTCGGRVPIIPPESKAISSCCYKCGAEYGRDRELIIIGETLEFKPGDNISIQFTATDIPQVLPLGITPIEIGTSFHQGYEVGWAGAMEALRRHPTFNSLKQPLELADLILQGLREYKQTKNKRPGYRHDLNWLAGILASIRNHEEGVMEALVREMERKGR